MTINDFDFAFRPKINRTEILDLCTLHFMDIPNDILFIGYNGAGKNSFLLLLY
ncbi:TPA: ATP-binding protein [Enterococcus hirae]|uniref:ATP-binding protein n=1 Tax=Enterococcus hirae TaxID=1354 RepID=UPI001F054B52|nr:ATP-binding protein [Enterococcus hirae]